MGSGRYEHKRTKGTVTNDRALDIRHWQREGVIKPGLRFEVQWEQQGALTLGIAVRVEEQQVVLAYRHSRSDGSLMRVEYPITLGWTPCPFGSQRPWFRCPTEDCGKRVAILHLDHRNAQFTCRHCQGLAYASQREDRVDRSLRRNLDILPALKDGDSSVEGTMPRTENTECSLISPVQQATPVAQPTGNRWAETECF